jgi:hypothetical protein
MRTEEIIAGMCLYGFIKNEKPSEQARCLKEIKCNYGNAIAGIVEDFMKRG